MLGTIAKAFGRWGDDTATITRRIAHHLAPEEEVLAAVYVRRPGTAGASLEAGTRGAISSAAGADGGVTSVRAARTDDPAFLRWIRQAESFGLEAQVARRAIKLIVAVTSTRLLLLRQAYASGRVRELIAAWALSDIEKIAVPRGSASLTIYRAGSELRLELPNAHRFLAPVYRDLPNVVKKAQAAAQGDQD